MLPQQTTVLLIIVAEVLSFLVLLALLVVLYRILVVRYKKKKEAAPRDIEASPVPTTAAPSPTPSPEPSTTDSDKELLLHPALRINTNVTAASPPPVLKSTITKPGATANPTNKPTHTPPEPFQSGSAQLQYKYLLSRLHTRPSSQRTQAVRSASTPQPQSAPVPRPLRPIKTTLLPPKKPMPVIQESSARGSVNVVSPSLAAVRPPTAAYRML
ncbi:hypothetical protein FQN49_008764 [Arthroderma sp. PD_2]|nr:hypothetical protein FQN49_008764 [Arthroderma sp. PD_2]